MGQQPEDKLTREILCSDNETANGDDQPTTDQTFNVNPQFANSLLISLSILGDGINHDLYVTMRIWVFDAIIGWIAIGDERINFNGTIGATKQIPDYGIHGQCFGVTFPDIPTDCQVTATCVVMARQALN
jgi:hypothetical protein